MAGSRPGAASAGPLDSPEWAAPHPQDEPALADSDGHPPVPAAAQSGAGAEEAVLPRPPTLSRSGAPPACACRCSIGRGSGGGVLTATTGRLTTADGGLTGAGRP